MIVDLSQYEITNKRNFPVYGAEAKYLTTLIGQDGLKMEAVVKDVSRFCPDGKIPSQWYLDLWNSYMEGGIDTHEWIIALNEDCIIMPNLYSEGWRMYGKSSFHSLTKRLFPLPLAESDLIVTALTADEIEKAISEHVNKASDHGIVLPHDDPFELFVNKNGQWGIKTLDLTFSSTDEPIYAEYKNLNRINHTIKNIYRSIEILSGIYQVNPDLFKFTATA